MFITGCGRRFVRAKVAKNWSLVLGLVLELRPVVVSADKSIVTDRPMRKVLTSYTRILSKQMTTGIVMLYVDSLFDILVVTLHTPSSTGEELLFLVFRV